MPCSSSPFLLLLHLDSFVFRSSSSAQSCSWGLISWWTEAVCRRWSWTLSFAPVESHRAAFRHTRLFQTVHRHWTQQQWIESEAVVWSWGAAFRSTATAHSVTHCWLKVLFLLLVISCTKKKKSQNYYWNKMKSNCLWWLSWPKVSLDCI